MTKKKKAGGYDYKNFKVHRELHARVERARRQRDELVRSESVTPQQAFIRECVILWERTIASGADPIDIEAENQKYERGEGADAGEVELAPKRKKVRRPASRKS